LKVRVFERKGKKGSTWYIDFMYKGRRRWEAIGADRRLAELAAKKREMEIKYALSNSFGFGGTNAALLLKHFEG